VTLQRGISLREQPPLAGEVRLLGALERMLGADVEVETPATD